MMEVERKEDDITVLISGTPAGITDAGDDYIRAECDLADLASEPAQPFPAGLLLDIHSENGFGTYLLHDLELSGAPGGVGMAFRCHKPNKDGEGQFGLAKVLAA